MSFYSFVLQVCAERHRFETLMDYFKNYEEFHIDFMVSHNCTSYSLLGTGLEIIAKYLFPLFLVFPLMTELRGDVIVTLSWHEWTSCYANPWTLSVKEGSHYYKYKSIWSDLAQNWIQTPIADAKAMWLVTLRKCLFSY